MALDSHPFFPLHVAWGCCFLSAAAASAPVSVASAFTEPSGWCAGAVLDVAWCAVCASVAPSSWRTEVVLVVVGVVRPFLLSTYLHPQAVHNLPLCVSLCVSPMSCALLRTGPAVAHWARDPLGINKQWRCAARAPGLAPWVHDPLRALVAARNASGPQWWPTGCWVPERGQTKTLCYRGPRVGPLDAPSPARPYHFT